MDVSEPVAARNPPDPAPLAVDDHGAVVHTPVMRERITALLGPALQTPGAIHVDVTLGMAGHASAILADCPNARLIGIDQDADALAIAERTLHRFAGRFELVQARFDELADVLDDLGIAEINSLLADLGLSSLQIDQRDRGFAYAADAPLDMRMDARNPRTAAQVLNTSSQAELVRILRRYGEEPHAERIARAIVTERAREPFSRSARLVDVISAALPAAVRHGGGHPAKRTF
ncbi:MAG: 16S rRNA (cytosine(1402)-N(4))-methyltransferase RsmH, partial [Propionibacteriaceae bacterium]|nr:16S rRNA (cytosine(1402)-N(4))-methyltransferase RsmH [Propionibacteriaceae bacterium]